MSKEKKLTILRNFLALLLSKYCPKGSLYLIVSEFNTGAFFSQINGKNIISISSKDLEKFNQYELCYIIAHEFNHFLERPNHLYKIFKQTSVLFCSIVLLINLLFLIIFLIEIYNLHYVFLFLIYPLSVIVFSEPFSHHLRKQEEIRCDSFANNEIGGGCSIFESINEYKESYSKKLLKILRFGIIFNSYPSKEDRIIESKKFPLNPETKFFIDHFCVFEFEDNFN